MNDPSLRIQVEKLREAWLRGEGIHCIHYACESLHDVKDRLPGVSGIAVTPLDESNAQNFTQSNFLAADQTEAEIRALEQYFSFIAAHDGDFFVHWNMSRPGFGFAALENRYRQLTNSEPSHLVPDSHRFDLADILLDTFGQDYIRHSRLPSLAALNKLPTRYVLTGEEEAKRIAARDHAAAARSTNVKVEWLAKLTKRFLDGQLETLNSSRSIDFCDQRLDVVELLHVVGQRMLYVQRDLQRRHANRKTLVVKDEYDAQDLFRSLLRLFFDNIVEEAWVPSYAGGASRIDFVFPKEHVAVELKRSRPTMSAKDLGEQLIVDIAKYRILPGITHLVCLIFDHDGHIANPKGIEQDLKREHSTETMAVSVFIYDR